MASQRNLILDYPLASQPSAIWDIPQRDDLYDIYNSIHTLATHLPVYAINPVAAGGDESSNIQAALNLVGAAGGGTVLLNPGVWNIATKVSISYNNTYLAGSGIDNTIIMVTSPTEHGIELVGGRQHMGVCDLTIDRNVVPAVNATGLDASAVIGLSYLNRLKIQNHYHNLRLGATDYSVAENIICQFAYAEGVILSNSGAIGTLQWQLKNVLAQMNTNRGFLVLSTAGPAQITMGNWVNCATFGNSGVGAAFVGLPAVAIQGVRLFHCFFGEDGNSEIFLDTYGSEIQIMGGMFELAGRAATGRTLATPASNVGCGIEITANNGLVVVTSPIINAHSNDGILTSCDSLLLSNPKITNNGLAAVAGRMNGVYYFAGGLNWTGGCSKNEPPNVSQMYGLSIGGGVTAGFNIADVDMNVNAIAGILDAFAGAGVIHHCSGWNPVGIAAVAVGASPFVYVAGHSDETIYISGGTVTIIDINGVVVFNNTDNTVHLSANDALTVTYTALPIMVAAVH